MPINFSFNNNILKIILSSSPVRRDFTDILKLASNYKNIAQLKLDLSHTDYIRSKDITELISLKKIIAENGVQLLLINVKEGVYQLLELMDLLPYFNIGIDYSSFSCDELLAFFSDPDAAQQVSDYIAQNYSSALQVKLYELLNNNDPIYKEWAILTMGKAHDTGMISHIREALNHDASNVVRAAAIVTGWLNDSSSKEKLYELLKSDFIDVVSAAAISIALMANDADPERLKKLLASNDERIRMVGINCLGLINDEHSYNILYKHFLKEHSEMIRANVVKTLSFFHEKELGKFFISLLEDRSTKIQEAAVNALIRIRATDKIKYLIKKVTDKNVWVGYFATKAVGALCKDAYCADTLIKHYDHVRLQIKLAILDSLGKIGIDCSDFLYSLLEDTNYDIRKEALNALSLINKEKALAAAYNLLEKDDNWLVRIKAVDIIGSYKPDGFLNLLKKRLYADNNKYVKQKILEYLENYV